MPVSPFSLACFSAPPVLLSDGGGRFFVTVASLLVSSRVLYEVVRTGKYAWRFVCADNKWWHSYDRTATNYQ